MSDTDTQARAMDDLAELRKRIALFRGELKQPKKSRTVTVQPREGRAYQFSYADLSECLSVVDPLLSKHGIALTHGIEERDNLLYIFTRIAFGTAEEVCGIAWPRPSKVQELGSALTYIRRYTLTALLGLAADDDDDGNAADGNAVTPGPGKARKPSPPEQTERKAEIVNRAKAEKTARDAGPESPAEVKAAKDKIFGLIYTISRPAHDPFSTPEQLQEATQAAVETLIAATKTEQTPAGLEKLRERLSGAVGNQERENKVMDLIIQHYQEV